MNLSLGELIGIDIKKSGLSVTHVAQEMGMSRKGLTDLLKRDDMSLSQLNSLSEVLQKDYFELYKNRLIDNAGKKLDYMSDETIEYVRPEKKRNEISLSVKVTGDMEKIKDGFPEFLSTLQREAELRGLYLG